MANEDKKDFNAMLHRTTDMPRIQLVTDAATVQKYGGARMYFAPAADYDAVMKRVPFGKVLTVGKIDHLRGLHGMLGFALVEAE